MGIVELYSKRQARLRGELPDVYTYDDIPREVRVQIVHVLRDLIGKDSSVPLEVEEQQLVTIRVDCRSVAGR